MKVLMIVSTLVTFGLAASVSSKEEIKLPLVADVENTFHPVFDDKPVECTKFNIKVTPLNKFDKEWLIQHGGEALVLTKENTTIKIGDEIYKPNKKYSVMKNQDVEIYNQDTLVFKSDYENFKNMMSYADNEYSFLLIPITIVFSECT